MRAYCQFNGIGVIPWGPIAGGSLTRPIGSTQTKRTEAAKGMPWESQFSDADKAVIGRVEEIAKKRGKSMAQVALAWVGGKVSSPIVGISKVERLEEAIAATGFKLTKEEENYLEEP